MSSVEWGLGLFSLSGLRSGSFPYAFKKGNGID